MTQAAAIAQAALTRAAAGDDAGAVQIFAQGLIAFPRDARFANSAGSYHDRAGRPADALALFDRALAVMPALHEAAINRAVVLTKLGRAPEAATDLAAREREMADAPRYWTTRAAAEIAAGNHGGAARSYDAALARDPRNARALGGRAWTALERGEDRAVDDHQRALSATPGDAALMLGLARALRNAGRRAEAMQVSAALVAQRPGWREGLELHADLRWAAGETDRFADHYAAAVAAAPDPALFRSWAAMLSGVDRHDAAVAVLATARRRWPDDATLGLAEAIAAGEAGDNDRAETIFAKAASSHPDGLVAHARHRLRRGDPSGADALLATALAAMPDDVIGWSLRDLCWRLLDDPHHGWLHGHEGAIRSLTLDLSATDLAAMRTLLDGLHRRSAMPIGQSVKRGSQTRGALFARWEPQIARFAAAVDRVVGAYRAGLPPVDAAHPLLRHRDTAWRIAGSWSIRLDGAGHHAAHIHPQGILSSAAYVTVPGQVADEDGLGWLELGRPPANLSVDLPPIAMIRPREGECALFPSTLFHGTRPISAGQRMTVAFDVAASPTT